MRLLLIILLALIYTGCNKTEDTRSETENSNLQKAEEAEKAFFIGDKSYTSKEFEDFIKKHYSSDTEKIEVSHRLKSKLLDIFIAKEIIALHAIKSGVDISPEDVESYIKKVGNKSISKDDLKKSLLVQKYLSDFVYSDINVSDKEIQDYYTKNREEFKRKKEVLLYQIMLKDKNEAEKIRTELVNYPSRFEEYASSRSLGLEASKNGLMGYYQQGTLPSEMEQVVFSMKTGEISPVVTTPYGYHIFLVKKKRRARSLYLSKVTDKIREKLMAVKIKKAYDEFYSNLFKRSNVRIVYDKLGFEYKK